VSSLSTLPTGVPFCAPDSSSTSEYDAARAVAGDDRHSGDASSGFSGFGLPAVILRAIRALGYEQPTAIQREAIPALLTGRDVTGVAQTGTGKTAAYGLPLLASIEPAEPVVQALVLVPTRELAIQVTDALTAFADGTRIGITAIYGGAPMGRQITALKRGAQVVVGTPGRVIDLIERKSLRLDGVTFAVLDEADEMLRMGFAEDVDRILTKVPAERQTALFSATMPKEIRRVAAQHLRRPVDVSVAASATPVTNIEQQYIVLPFRDKASALERIIAVSGAEAAVVFVRTRSACDELGSALIASGVKAAFISGDVSQNERERTIDRLRGGQVDVLVATDVAARGMDVERIGLVVNFDAPSDPETYIHRIGRTGRAGRSGRAVTFFTPKETSRLRFIEKTIGRKLEEIDVPSAAQVLDRRAEAALAGAVERQPAGRLDHYLHALSVAADIAGLTRDELAAALLATVVGDDGTLAVDIAPSRQGRRDSTARPESREFRGRRDETDRRSRATDNARRTGRADRPGRHEASRSDRSWHGTPAHDSRDDRRPWDGPRRERSGDVARTDGPRKTKPRWDAARRAERHGGPDTRGTASHGGSASGTTWGGRDGANRAAARPDRPGSSRSHQPAPRRSQRSASY